MDGRDESGLEAGLQDGSWQRLDPRAVRLWREALLLSPLVLCLALAGLGTAAWRLLDPPPRPVSVAALVVAGLALLLASRAAWLPGLRFRHARYRVDPFGIEVRHGAIWRHAIAVPRSRLQHVDVTQGPLERRHGCATLVLHTAGGGHGSITVEGLAHARALALRDLLVAGTEAGDERAPV